MSARAANRGAQPVRLMVFATWAIMKYLIVKLDTIDRVISVFVVLILSAVRLVLRHLKRRGVLHWIVINWGLKSAMRLLFRTPIMSGYLKSPKTLRVIIKKSPVRGN